MRTVTAGILSKGVYEMTHCTETVTGFTCGEDLVDLSALTTTFGEAASNRVLASRILDRKFQAAGRLGGLLNYSRA